MPAPPNASSQSNDHPNPNLSEARGDASVGEQVDILILGGGWTSTFLIPLCEARGVRYAVTSRTGRSGTIKFEFDQTLDANRVTDQEGGGSGRGGVGSDRDGNSIADTNRDGGSGSGGVGVGDEPGVGNGGPRDPRTDADADIDAQVDVETQREEDADPEGFHRLPKARTVLITFPITKPGAVGRLVRMYVGRCSKQLTSTRDGGEGEVTGDGGAREGGEGEVNFIQLGTTSIWNGVTKNHIVAEKHVTHDWYDRHSPYTRTDRAASEEELLALDNTFFLTSHGANTQDAKNTQRQTRIRLRTTVLNLSGLWGGTRDPRHWVERIAPSKDVLRNKGSIHMIHGSDLARAILAVHAAYTPTTTSLSSSTSSTTTSSSSSGSSSRGEWRAGGERWLLTDGRVYDWWDLIAAWGAPTVTTTATTTSSSSSSNPSSPSSQPQPQPSSQPTPPNRIQWVFELMTESTPVVRALPRNVELLGRCLDSREFWGVFGVWPERGRLELVGGGV